MTQSGQYQQAIRWIRQGDWEQAHQLVQSQEDELACWIHAWLHRQEGDQGNARYWYQRAGRPFPETGLQDELELIASQLD